MDPDEVSRLVAELKISRQQNDGGTLTLDDGDLAIGKQRDANCLVAKVLSPKMINPESFKQQMPRILQAIKTVETSPMGDNIFVLDFHVAQDRKRALNGGPWNFFRDLVIFVEPKGMQNPRTMKFISWIQCYNLPLACMHKNILQKVESQIGMVEEIDSREDGFSTGRFARIRVRIDVSKPLKKFIKISFGHETEDIIVPLAYERLPDFCYNCGCLGHAFRDCVITPVEKGKLAFGTWLRANNSKGGARARQSSPKKFADPRKNINNEESEGHSGDNMESSTAGGDKGNRNSKLSNYSTETVAPTGGDALNEGDNDYSTKAQRSTNAILNVTDSEDMPMCSLQPHIVLPKEIMSNTFNVAKVDDHDMGSEQESILKKSWKFLALEKDENFNTPVGRLHNTTVLGQKDGTCEMDFTDKLDPISSKLGSSLRGWQRRACEKRQQSDIQSTVVKEKGKEIVGEDSSQNKKRLLEEYDDTNEMISLAVVAKQPRRSQ